MSPFSMFRRISVATVLALAVTAQALDTQQVAQDVALAKDAFERVHPGYDRYTTVSALDAAWQAITDDARAGGMSDGEFYLRLQGVLALMRCGHTKAELPSAMAKARRTEPVYLPLRFELVENRAIVIATVSGGGVDVHDELLSIDGIDIATLVERYAPYIPVDGFTDHTKRFELAWSLEFSGGAIEHFMALEGVPPVATLRVRNQAGVERTVMAPRIGLTAQRDLVDPGEANFVDAVKTDFPDSKTAVLSVGTFVNYRKPVDPDDVYGPVFKSLQERGIEHLILDLRQNGGGSDDARDRLLAHLITEKTYIFREQLVKTLDLDGLRDHLSTWDSRALNPKRWWFSRTDEGMYRMRSWWFGAGKVKPARDAFKGRLTVLSSAGNASGTTMLMAALKETGRARVVGETTGGNVAGPTAGVLFTLTLPHSGIRLRLPIVRPVTGYDPDDTGRGVEPDVRVVPSVDDLRSGRDRTMEAALD